MRYAVVRLKPSCYKITNNSQQCPGFDSLHRHHIKIKKARRGYPPRAFCVSSVRRYLNNIVNTNARMNRNPIANKTGTPAGIVVTSSGSEADALAFSPPILR